MPPQLVTGDAPRTPARDPLEMIDEHFERRFADLGQRLDQIEARWPNGGA